ncbi:uncharacterized protein TRIADDRAFT_19404 [Trichoplax adhaerens]|uniref:Solute carrier organic anion transporter family member n=1 Tax=Trichoplax adhaerens TaxID=10228 RepID=B3RLK6_TRIAD|nr:hypothetical protein TRIADDRAFT_19404 [Trichoplax adhaerens]EDV28794.1 hypothetical protein TRIADDRAFT_19404 [Trichoplax adhaerens]|eukprot:XP_002107996.1 hypothetical protein TRIADDRAFT_19404 [Trichoplax adhaerens]
MQFGLGRCQFQFCQWFNSPKWLLVFTSSYIIIASMLISGFTAVAITSLETRFELRSTESGTLYSAYEVAAAFFGIITSYYAGQGHKGRYLAASAVVISIGALIFALPHWITSNYVAEGTIGSELCHYNVTMNQSSTSVCANLASPVRVFLYVFLLAQALIGAGNNIVWTTGMAYIDENVSPTTSSVYVGIMVTVAAIGPAIGFLLGGIFLNLWVDWPNPSQGIVPTDPRWVGAWWLGFLVCAVGMFIISIPLFAYPRHLPDFQKHKLQRQKTTIGKSRVDNEYGNSITDLPRATKELILNKPFIFTVLAATAEALVTNGFAPFLPKFIQSQFSTTSSGASFISGIVVVPGAGGGMILGSLLMKYFRMDKLRACKLNVVFGFLSCISCLAFLIGCDAIPFAGANTPVESTMIPQAEVGNITSECNINCGCLRDKFDPICGINGIAYFSPCHAGCQDIDTSIPFNQQTFSNCTCILTQNNANDSELEVPFDAQRGLCAQNCNNLIPFLVVLFIQMICTYVKSVPSTQVVLRTVPESQRSFALGLQWLLIRLLGDIPGPLLIGLIIDTSCNVWNIECGEKTSCWLYNNRQMGYLVFAFVIICKGASTVFFALAWYYCRTEIKNEQKDDDNIYEKQLMSNSNFNSMKKATFQDVISYNKEDFNNFQDVAGYKFISREPHRAKVIAASQDNGITSNHINVIVRVSRC